MSQRFDTLLRTLALIDRGALSSVGLAAMLGCSSLTAMRTVNALRDLGCVIHAERDWHDYWDTLTDWGVFSPERVRKHVASIASR